MPTAIASEPMQFAALEFRATFCAWLFEPS